MIIYNKTCFVCFNDYKEDEPILIYDCLHTVHNDCVKNTLW